MKKLLSVLLLCNLTAAYAQNTTHYGVKADASLFKLQGEGIQSKYTIGGQIGVFAYRDFSARWGFQPELLITQANPKKSADFSAKYLYGGNVAANTNIKLNYITLPLLVRFNVNKMITINAGPQYSYLFFLDENLLNYDRRAFKRNDLGAAAGLTLTFDRLHVYGRYVWGLSNINDIDDRYQWKTQQAQVGLGLNIK